MDKLEDIRLVSLYFDPVQELFRVETNLGLSETTKGAAELRSLVAVALYNAAENMRNNTATTCIDIDGFKITSVDVLAN
jgi:hypothetical protein